MMAKFFIFMCLTSFVLAQDETTVTETTVTRKLTDPTTAIPKTTEPADTTTTDINKIIFDKPEVVTAEINEAIADLNRTVIQSIENFKTYSKEKLEQEISSLFNDFEKVQLIDTYEGRCFPEQLTAYEGFQTSLDRFIEFWVEAEHSSIAPAILQTYYKFIDPFRIKIKGDFEGTITKALRFGKSNIEKNVQCANTFTPQIIRFTESAFNHVLNCLVLNMNYNQTIAYQEIIMNLYKDTAGYLAVCTNNVCFKRTCPKTHLLVTKTVSKATEAMTFIISNFKKEISTISACTSKKFSDSEFNTNMTLLLSNMKACFV